MTASYRYDVEILHLLVSPAHAYFGRAREGAARGTHHGRGPG